MITAPSTMMPKSIAPKLIRLALTLVSTMPVIVMAMDRGMTQAGDQRGADVAEDQEQHGHDQRRAFQQIVLDRADGGLDQVGAVVHGPRHDALGQRFGDLVETCRDALAPRCGCSRRSAAWRCRARFPRRRASPLQCGGRGLP